MGFRMAMLLAVSALLVASVAQADPASDREALQGRWRLKRGEQNGQPIPQAQLTSARLVIEGDHYSLIMGNVGPLEGTQKLGESNGLSTIDITDRDGETCLGIYDLDGDQFHVVFAEAGDERPTSFNTAPGAGQWMHVWEHERQ